MIKTDKKRIEILVYLAKQNKPTTTKEIRQQLTISDKQLSTYLNDSRFKTFITITKSGKKNYYELKKDSDIWQTIGAGLQQIKSDRSLLNKFMQSEYHKEMIELNNKQIPDGDLKDYMDYLAEKRIRNQAF